MKQFTHTVANEQAALTKAGYEERQSATLERVNAFNTVLTHGLMEKKDGIRALTLNQKLSSKAVALVTTKKARLSKPAAFNAKDEAAKLAKKLTAKQIAQLINELKAL